MSEYRDFEPKPVIPKIPKDDPEPIIKEPDPIKPDEEIDPSNEIEKKPTPGPGPGPGPSKKIKFKKK